MASHKQNHISLHQRGEKVFTHFLYKMTDSWPQILCLEASMMIWAILRNFTILGVEVTIMAINQNVSIEMYLEYILHFV